MGELIEGYPMTQPASRWRGRPALVLEDPDDARARGIATFQQRMRDHRRRKLANLPCREPKQPRSKLEARLIYASNAGVIAPNAIGGMLERTRAFQGWLKTAGGARGPAPNVKINAQVHLASEVAVAKRRKERPSGRVPSVREVGWAWCFLFGANQAVDENTMKRRIQRYRDRFDAFERHRKRGEKGSKRTCRQSAARPRRAEGA